MKRIFFSVIALIIYLGSSVAAAAADLNCTAYDTKGINASLSIEVHNAFGIVIIQGIQFTIDEQDEHKYQAAIILNTPEDSPYSSALLTLPTLPELGEYPENWNLTVTTIDNDLEFHYNLSCDQPYYQY